MQPPVLLKVFVAECTKVLITKTRHRFLIYSTQNTESQMLPTLPLYIIYKQTFVNVDSSFANSLVHRKDHNFKTVSIYTM